MPQWQRPLFPAWSFVRPRRPLPSCRFVLTFVVAPLNPQRPRYGDQSLGGFGDVEMDATGERGGSASGARVSGVDVTGISNDLTPNDDESVEVYSSTSRQGW